MYRDAIPVSAIRSFNTGLSRDEAFVLADQCLRVIRDYYVHLPVKTSSLAIDPVQELTLLLDDLNYYYEGDSAFFYRLQRIIKRLRDRHTSLRLPAPFSQMVAFLPFAVESFWEGDRRLLIVSKVLDDVGDSDFEPGVEVTHWNGVPIGIYVERLGGENEGANPFARISVALRSMTVRPLAYMLPPDEDWVTLSYIRRGEFRSVSIPWRVYFPNETSAVQRRMMASGAGVDTVVGLDKMTALVNGGWEDLYSARWTREAHGVFLDPDPLANIENPLKENLEFHLVHYAGNILGYIRIFSFEVADVRAFLTSFAIILRLMPQTGLIIDTRSNPGGTIPAGEGVLQLLSRRPIFPERVSFRVTTAIQRLAMESPYFIPWRRSLGIRYETGQQFTQGFSLYDPTMTDGLHGVYSGKVVVITDALSYSTTDFFAAGFQDNGLGPVIGTDSVSGAGGANVWTHSQLYSAVLAGGDASLSAMPRGADLNFSLRRSTRVGVNEDLPLEGLGVVVDVPYRLSRRDVLGRNEDLITFAGFVLSRL